MEKQDKIKKLLTTFIAMESVSADTKRFAEVKKTAVFLQDTLAKMGCTIKLIEREAAAPFVLATYKVQGAKKTIGIYGHYDVQSEDPTSEWNSAPYTLVEREGRFWARGIADNKGHIVQNIAAIGQLIEAGTLKNNIIFILEGEEEKGSVNLEPFLQEVKNELSHVDVFFITDTGMYSKTEPQIFYGLRGLVYFELNILIGERDLHSGMYGNTVPNPALVAAELLGKMKDNRTGEVLIPGFYNDVRPLAKEERKALESIARTNEELELEAGVRSVQSLKGESAYLSSKVLPSLDINGMVSGYTGDGPKTIIPRSATIKFSCRLVENQKPATIRDLIMNYIEEELPETVDYRIDILSEDAPFYTGITNSEVLRTAQILTNAFKNETIFNRSGGSIPAAEFLQRLFQKPVILTGFTLPDDNIHSPNENMDVQLFWKGIEVLKEIYS